METLLDKIDEGVKHAAFKEDDLRTGHAASLASVDLADRIEKLRLARGWYQRELSRRAGLSEGTLNNRLKAIRERNGSLRGDTLEAIARAFGVDVAWLLTGRGVLGRKQPAPKGRKKRQKSKK